MNGYPRLASGVDWIDIDGQVLLLDQEQLYLLDLSASQIWTSIDGCRSAAQIGRALKVRYPEALLLEADVTAFVEDLVERGLATIVARPTGDGLRIPDHVGWTQDGATVIIADLRTGAREALSDSGTQVWLGVVDGMGRQALLARLNSRYSSTPLDVGDTVDALLDSLLHQGFLARA